MIMYIATGIVIVTSLVMLWLVGYLVEGRADQWKLRGWIILLAMMMASLRV
jgi:hypothetical protein